MVGGANSSAWYLPVAASAAAAGAVATTAVGASHAAGASGLLAGAVGEGALELEHGSGDLVTQSGLALLVVNDVLAAEHATAGGGSSGSVVCAMHFDEIVLL
jgi:hypothetical protein